MGVLEAITREVRSSDLSGSDLSGSDPSGRSAPPAGRGRRRRRAPRRWHLASVALGFTVVLVACGGAETGVDAPGTDDSGPVATASSGTTPGTGPTDAVTPGSGSVREAGQPPVVEEVAAGFARLNDLDVDPSGIPWVTDANNSALVELAPDGPVTHFTGEQTSTDPESEMSGLAIAGDGTVWFATRKGIHRLDPETDAVELVVPAASTELAGPVYRLAVDSSGGLFIGDVGQDKVFRLDGSTLEHVAGAGGAAKAGAAAEGPARSAVIGEIRELAVGPDGTVYIADDYAHRVHELSLGEGVMRTFAGGGATRLTAKGEAAPTDTAGTALDLETPYSVWVVDTTVTIIDSYDSTVFSIDADGVGDFEVRVGPGVVTGGTTTRGAAGPDGAMYLVVGGSTVVRVT